MVEGQYIKIYQVYKEESSESINYPSYILSWKNQIGGQDYNLTDYNGDATGGGKFIYCGKYYSAIKFNTPTITQPTYAELVSIGANWLVLSTQNCEFGDFSAVNGTVYYKDKYVLGGVTEQVFITSRRVQ